MILTVQDILVDAMGLVGATEMDETPAASELSVALRTLNIMVDRWSSQRLMLRSTDSLTFTAVVDQNSYTIGATDSDIVATKPLRVISGYVTDNQIDFQLTEFTKAEYNNLQDKNVSLSRPMYFCYDPDDAQQNVQQGTLYLYYTPDKPYSITIEYDAYLAEFVNLSDTVNFEPSYYEALIYNLAARLFRRYNPTAAQIPQDITSIAVNSLSNIKTLNYRRFPSAMDLPGVNVSVYNPYVDR